MKQTPEQQEANLTATNELARQMGQEGVEGMPAWAVLLGANLLGIYRQLGRIATALEAKRE